MRSWKLALAVAALTACQEKVADRDPVFPTVVATCAESLGEVQTRPAGRPYWTEAGVGTVLFSGSWLRTGKGAHARIEYASGAHFEIDDGAVVVIDQAPPAEQPGGLPVSVVTVETGQLRGLLQPSADGGSSEMVLRNLDGSQARLAVRGADPVDFRLSRRDEGTVVSVLSGAAIVSANSRAQAVSGGDSTHVTLDGPAALHPAGTPRRGRPAAFRQDLLVAPPTGRASASRPRRLRSA